MNEYEARQAARRQRYADRAERLRDQAADLFEHDRREMSAIPFGQPILVGHHSEGRHRNALKRSRQRVRKAIALGATADHYERRADITSNAISSDDPDAVPKLTARIASLEAAHAQMTALNAAWRRAGKPAPDDAEGWGKVAAIPGLTLSPDTISTIRLDMARDPMKRGPFPAYVLTNSSSNIRRLKERLAIMEREAEAEPAADVHGHGWVLSEDTGENRVMFTFPGKPVPEVRTLLKRHGFKWSPSRTAWVRMLNNAGRYAAQQVVDQLSA